MAAFLPARLSWFAVPALALLLSTAGLTSAAPKQQSTASRAAPAAARPATVVVPDVRGQAYVFAKGMLEDAGLAWKVEGGVNGFAVNLVASQSPAPGTRLVDTGAPTITLQLERNARYAEQGVPENFAPYAGTRVQRPAARRPGVKPQAKPPKATPKQPAVKQPKRAKTKPAVKRPKAAPEQQRQTKNPAQLKKPAVQRPAGTALERRPPAFIVPGAPKEPHDEMPLPRRASDLGAWLDQHPRPTDANVGYWLYQHAWIVTGAKFGWWRGAEALRVLIAVDGRVISAWGIGARSRAVARAALAEVAAKAR